MALNTFFKKLIGNYFFSFSFSFLFYDERSYYCQNYQNFYYFLSSLAFDSALESL